MTVAYVNKRGKALEHWPDTLEHITQIY